jgi:hypothetical protein
MGVLCSVYPHSSPTNFTISVAGEKDFLKSSIASLGGTIHFGRVFMKPGKPTTFATVTKDSHKCLVFALPGIYVCVWCNLLELNKACRKCCVMLCWIPSLCNAGITCADGLAKQVFAIPTRSSRLRGLSIHGRSNWCCILKCLTFRSYSILAQSTTAQVSNGAPLVCAVVFFIITLNLHSVV